MRANAGSPAWTVNPEIESLHQRCGVYTRIELVQDTLDAIGWTSQADLSFARLLEPAAGDGAFVAEAVRRLLESFQRQGREFSADALTERIQSYEIHPHEACRARARVQEILLSFGVATATASLLAQSWIRSEDFLLSDVGQNCFTHVTGNPPYARWSKIPQRLRQMYENVLPRRMTKGDLFLPFLDLGIGCLAEGGRLGFVCTNRWRYMGFAEEFRRVRLNYVQIELDRNIKPSQAYERDTHTYPSLIVMRRLGSPHPIGASEGRALTLSDAGYRVRVGPALGVTDAFVLNKSDARVEEELLAPWVSGSELGEDAIRYRGRHVISLHDELGNLRDIEDFPLAKSRLEHYRGPLSKRYITLRGGEWYRTIDKVIAADWKRPKLLVPEMSIAPTVSLDLTGFVPSHGVYAIMAPDDDLDRVLQILKDGGLERRLARIAPRVRGGYLRAYKRFLDQISLED